MSLRKTDRASVGATNAKVVIALRAASRRLGFYDEGSSILVYLLLLLLDTDV